MPDRFIKSEPYAWPYNGDLRPENTALIIIDMQTDFCGVGGYVDKMGYDLSLTRAPIEPIKRLLAVMRAQGFTSSTPARDIAPISRIYPPTSSGVAPDRRRNRRSRPLRPRAGARRGRLGDHPGPRAAARRADHRQARQGSFCATDLELMLRLRGIENIVLTGITTDVCVHTTMREANDRGFECVLIEDCCAATDKGNHEHALKMIKMQGGVFGAVASSADLIGAIS